MRRRDGTFAALLSLGLYLWTLAPGLVWGDSAELALAVHDGDLGFGTAGDHPLFVLLGMVFARLPGDLARNVNLVSAVSAAVTVGLVQIVTARLARSAFAGFAAAAALAVSHAFWQHAVMAEVYTLNAAFVALLVFILLEWRDGGMRDGTLVIAAFVFALGLTNHLVLASLLPGLALFVLLYRRPSRAFLWSAGAVGVVVLLCALLLPPVHQALLRVWYGPPRISHYFAPPAHARDLPREIGFYGTYLFYQFPLAGIALGALGMRALFRRDLKATLFLLVALGANAFVFVKTTEWASPSTKYTFYIHDYVVFAMFIGAGAAEAARRFGRPAVIACLLVCPVLLYNLVPPVMHRLGVEIPGPRRIAFRDNATFFLNPSRRGDDGPRRYGEAAFAAVAPGGLVVADWAPRVVLRYLQRVEGRRPDVVLVAGNTHLRPRNLTFLLPRLAAGQPVYLAGEERRYYDIDSLSGGFRLNPAGVLFRVVPSSAATGR